jgi:hypothetical protein
LSLDVVGDDLVIETDRDPPAPLLAELRQHKSELVALLKEDQAERAAIVEYDGGMIPRAWAEGFAALCSMPTPTGFRPGRWHRIVDAAGVFIDRWAAEAARRGWTDLDVFGCNPDRPDARFDAMGLVLLLDRCEITSIDELGADLVTNTGARQRFRRRPLPADTIALWRISG